MAKAQRKPALESGWTADDLLDLPNPGGERYELIDGGLEIREPPGLYHGYLLGNLCALIRSWARSNHSGRVFVGDVGLITHGDRRTVRAPDLAYYSYERLPDATPPRGFGEVAPELVVEVLSPGDRPGDTAAKVAAWLEFGVLAVWVVDPENRSVWAVDRQGERTWRAGEVLPGEPALPGFRVPVLEVFGD